MNKFQIIKTSPLGRCGIISTINGIIHTPELIFCATKGSIKGLPIYSVNAQAILCNTYHLLVYPGIDAIDCLGGIHKLTGWNKPIMTDSGGFQIFCFGHGSVANELKRTSIIHRNMVKSTQIGAMFKSYRNGQSILLTPELSINMQHVLKSNILINFDYCTSYHLTKSETAEALELTNHWQERGLKQFLSLSSPHGLYYVVQGGIYPDLRIASLQNFNDHYAGYAIGGSLGKTKDDLKLILETFYQNRNPDKPVHLLGMGGYFSEVLTAIKYGVDTFDCVHPTRVARHGLALSTKGPINLRNSTKDLGPIDIDCNCPTCASYSRMALHILFRAGENAAMQAITVHNIFTMQDFMQDVRNGIMNDSFRALYAKWLTNLQ